MLENFTHLRIWRWVNGNTQRRRNCGNRGWGASSAGPPAAAAEHTAPENLEQQGRQCSRLQPSGWGSTRHGELAPVAVAPMTPSYGCRGSSNSAPYCSMDSSYGPDNLTTADTRMTQHPLAPFFPCSSRACDAGDPKRSVGACHPCAPGDHPGDTCGIRVPTTRRQSRDKMLQRHQRQPR